MHLMNNMSKFRFKTRDNLVLSFALATQSQQLVAGFTGLKYVDVNAVLPALNVLAAISVLVAFLFFFNVFRRHWVIPVIGAVLLLASSIVVGTIYPMLVQQFQPQLVRPPVVVGPADASDVAERALHFY